VAGPRGTVGKLYFVVKTTAKGGIYKNGFEELDDARAWARERQRRGDVEVHIWHGYLSDLPWSALPPSKFKPIALERRKRGLRP